MTREHISNSLASAKLPNGAADDPFLTEFMDYYIVRKSESYKFIRMAEDLHDVARYLNEMRVCFLLLTGTVYILLGIYFVCWCVRRNRRRVNNPANNSSGRRLPNHRWGDLQGAEYENAITAQTTNIGQTASDDLVSVRSDGAVPGGKTNLSSQFGGTGQQHGLGSGSGPPPFGMPGRGTANRQAAPSFMRHGGSGVGIGSMPNHSGSTACPASSSLLSGSSAAATRLMADSDTGTVTKQQPSPIQHQHLTHQQTQQQQHGIPTSIHHSPHSPHHHDQQILIQHQQTSQHGSTGRPPPSGFLLNNIAEEREGSSNSGASSATGGSGVTTTSATTTPMSTFGWRTKEKVMLERHELQPMNNNGTNGEV
uniref:Uncharacterized protein n=1 Tax=Meloidogyne incognita TaxID=6306 RepID=A0A914LJ57_MELIC